MSDWGSWTWLTGPILLWLSEQAPLIALLLLLLLLVQSVRLYFVRRVQARRMERHRSMGEEAERRARSLLKKHDYRVVLQQSAGKYVLHIDDFPAQIALRADFVVEKSGKRYVAEVKSGAQSAKVTERTTRRQLLEYLLAFEVDGVLLVDMHDERIKKVEFPLFPGQ
jgi:hypothetical protein